MSETRCGDLLLDGHLQVPRAPLLCLPPPRHHHAHPRLHHCHLQHHHHHHPEQVCPPALDVFDKVISYFRARLCTGKCSSRAKSQSMPSSTSREAKYQNQKNQEPKKNRGKRSLFLGGGVNLIQPCPNFLQIITFEFYTWLYQGRVRVKVKVSHDNFP